MFSASCLQFRLARLGLKISVKELSFRTNIGINTIKRVEAGSPFDIPNMRDTNMEALLKFFNEHGVTFLRNNGLSFSIGALEANDDNPQTPMLNIPIITDEDNEECAMGA